MIEYLHDVIKASSGDTETITAKITNEAGVIVTDSCSFCIYDDKKKLLEVSGKLIENIWNFTLDEKDTADFNGRYWYAICDCDGNAMNFKRPIYFEL